MGGASEGEASSSVGGIGSLTPAGGASVGGATPAGGVSEGGASSPELSGWVSVEAADGGWPVSVDG